MKLYINDEVSYRIQSGMKNVVYEISIIKMEVLKK